MKKFIILVSILLCSSVAVQAQTDPFEKLMDMKGVTTVYISKSMLGMMSGMDGANGLATEGINGVNIGDAIKKLTSITVLTSTFEKPDALKALRKLASDITGSKAYEQLMFAKTDDSKTIIYAKFGNAKNNEESEMVMVVDDSSDKSCTLIRLTGTMTLADIQKITAKSTE